MIIRKIVTDEVVEKKIFRKHGILREELDISLTRGNPKYYRTKFGRYMAITRYNRFITVIFSYDRGTVHINTAYKSSKSQKRLYERS